MEDKKKQIPTPNSPKTLSENSFAIFAKNLAKLINVNDDLDPKDYPGSGFVEKID